VKVQRTQPPVGYRVPVADLARATIGRLTSGRGRQALEQQVAGHFGVRSAFAVSSGKAALTMALRAMHALTGRTKVILPAYTCYSVPSAIVKAGLIPVPCDIARGTFDYDYGRLQPMLGRDVLCALSVHLFGVASDTHRLKSLCKPEGIFVVEDAAQAMGVAAGSEWLGTRGDVGFFSLGRGKNITCGSGGLILTNEADIAARLGALATPGPQRIAADLRTLVELGAMSIFIAPRMYWLPSGIPSLRLGETIFHPDFPIHALSDFQALLLAGWSARLSALNEVRRETGAFYRRAVAAAAHAEADVPFLRFPVIVGGRAVRERILQEGKALGISAMYPASVGAIPQIRHLLSEHRFPEAERVAASLVTLPTHPLLTERDRRRVCELVNASAADSLAAVDDQRVAVKAR
jgi:perosamine synthetase